MTFDHIDRMVREANPVPNPAALDPVDASVLLDNWRNDMQIEQTIDRTHRKAPNRSGSHPRRWRPLVAAGAAALAVAAFLPGVTDRMLGGSGPVEVAERYMAARAALDAPAAVAELGADVELSEAPYVGDPEGMANAFAYLKALDYEMTDSVCSASEQARQSDPVVVRCDYRFETSLSQAVGLGQVEGQYLFLVEGGEIVRVLNTYDSSYPRRAFEVFLRWLDQEHPGVAQRMWVTAPDFSQRTFDHEAATLEELERYVAEFEAAQS